MITIRRVNWNRLEYNTNYQYTPFEEINAKNMEKLITSTGIITGITTPQTSVEEARYICSKCDDVLHFDKILSETEMKKQKCEWCGNEILEQTVLYKDTQILTIGARNTSKTIQLYLEDELTSHDKYKLYDTIQFKGFLRTVQKNNKASNLIIQCKSIDILSRMEEVPEETIEIDRNSPQYIEWVNEIQQRDKVCQICGGNKHLEAHHIYAYKNNPGLRTDIGNGVLLCTFCHKKFHSYYGKDVTPADLVKFIYEFKGL